MRAQLERQGGGLQPRRRKRKKDKKPKAIRYDTDGMMLRSLHWLSGYMYTRILVPLRRMATSLVMVFFF